jgi:hypothetical protein
MSTYAKLFVLKRKLTRVKSVRFDRRLKYLFVFKQNPQPRPAFGPSDQKFQLRALATMKSRNTFSLAAFFISLG